MSETIHRTIVIDGVTYNLIPAAPSIPKFKVGDWVKVVANNSNRLSVDSFIGEVAMVTYVPKFGEYKEQGKPAQAYGVGNMMFVVFEDELEPAEEPKPKDDPFDIKQGEPFYIIWNDGTVGSRFFDSEYEIGLKKAGNACKDQAAVKQRALHETLSRLLWVASEQAGEPDNEWNGDNRHYYIFYNPEMKSLGVDYSIAWTVQGTCFFPTEEAVQSAINNIVRPFMKEHPEFKW